MSDKIITIREHSFKIPQPKDKRDILFIDKKDPYWIREEALKDYKPIFFDFIPHYTKIYQEATLYDQDSILISLNKEDSDWMVWAYQREVYRRTHGVHVKMGDEIVWLTGDHWFILAWCKTKRPDKKSDYFDYREFQAKYLCLVWYVNQMSHIAGLFISKAKKTGITNLHWLYYLNKATMTKNINLGNMNIDQSKGAKTFRDHFLYAYHGLPMALKPKFKSKSEPDGVITFGQQFTNSKKNRIIKNDAEDELNTTVMCVPTMINAFDVDVFSDLWWDEPPKYKQDFGEIYRSNEAGTDLQDMSIGKKWLTSYTPEESGSSFMSSRDLFFDSELRTVKPESNGQTKSKLICDHIPAYESWTSSFDKYGKCNEVEAMAKIQHGRSLLKDKPRELQVLTRRYANDKREAWSTGGVGSVFDNIRLGGLLSNIEEEERISPQPLYKEFNLEWTNNTWNIQRNRRRKGDFCEVKLIPITYHDREQEKYGKFRFYFDIPRSQQNAALKLGKDEYGCLIPPDTFNYCLGGDPTNYAAASEVIQGSKNAIYVMNMPDMLLDSRLMGVFSKIIVVEYYDRPESPDEAFEDFLKLIIFTGALSTIEANAPYVATRLMEEGLGRFMMVKDKNGVIMPWKRYMGLPNEKDKTYHLIRTTANSSDKEVLETMVRLIKAYYEKPEEGGKDYGAQCKTSRLIKQLMDLNPLDTRLFDLFMAFGYTIITVELYRDMIDAEISEYNNPDSMATVLAALEDD